MTLKWEHRFTVCGQGAFPIDMLRYDSCHPHTGEDASVIESTFQHGRYTDGGLRMKSVTLIRFGDMKTDAQRVEINRWKSFGWNIAPEQPEFPTRKL